MRALRTFGVVFALVVAGCASTVSTGQSSPNPARLLTLTPDEQLDVYKDIEDNFPVRVVKRGPEVSLLPVSSQQVRPAVTWRGKTYTDLTAFMTDARMSGVIVLKDGRIVFENYALGRKPNDRWTSFSVAKSVTSMLIGAAVEDGSITSLDDPVTKYVPNLGGAGYDGVTVRQLLTMTSGVKWNEDYTDLNSDVAQSSNWPGEPGMNPLVSYMRRLPSEAKPGTKWVYKTGETDMAGILLSYAVHKNIADYLSEKIWKPYGMERDAIWMTDKGGMPRGGCCISMTLRDYARFALFVDGGGRAGGKQVVDPDYLKAAISDQVQPPADADYGYFWWGRGKDGFAALGIFGQSINFAPEDGVIMVVNSAFPHATDREYNAATAALFAAFRGALKD